MEQLKIEKPKYSRDTRYVLLPSRSGKKRWKRKRVHISSPSKVVVSEENLNRYFYVMSKHSQRLLDELKKDLPYITAQIVSLMAFKDTELKHTQSEKGLVFFVFAHHSVVISKKSIISFISDEAHSEVLKLPFFCMVLGKENLFIKTKGLDLTKIGFQKKMDTYYEEYFMDINLSSEGLDKFLTLFRERE